MENTLECSPVKRMKGIPLSLNEKLIIKNVHDYVKRELSSGTVDSDIERTSTITGVGKSTIYRLLREQKSGVLNPPKEHSGGKKKQVLPEETKTAIRRKVHEFFFKKEIPTLAKILNAIKEDSDLADIKQTKLWETLKELNFTWSKIDRKSSLIDKDEIICWRRKYLRTILQYRSEGRQIFYLDETWVNEGHTVSKVWQDKNIQTSRQAFMEGLSTGFKPPSGKGRRLIVVHIGSSKGFLNEGSLIFASTKTGDYHEDMNSDVFEEYFEQMIKFIPKGSVIVMDNASYHSRQIEKNPTSSWNKPQIVEWLRKKNIVCSEDLLKVELLQLVQLNRPPVRYAVDEIAAAHEINVLRLPPYHCELNPIELIWAQVKGDVARKNTTFKLNDVWKLLENSIKQVSADNWVQCIKHVVEEEKKMWEMDNILQATLDGQPLFTDVTPVTFVVNNSSSDSDESLCE